MPGDPEQLAGGRDGLVGLLPGADNVWALGAFSGHRFKLSPALGRVAADLVTTGSTALLIDHLDPARFLS